jgi:ribosomal protein S18 acetylase RimI-like enzyme
VVVPDYYCSIITRNMTSNKLHFRLATIEDAVLLERLINIAFRNDPTTEVFLSADHEGIDVTSVPQITSKITQKDSTLLVGTDSNGDMVAHCSVRKLDDNRSWFGMLAIDVDSQKRGLGSQVLDYAEEYVRREWGAKRMEFDVVCTRAELIAWYKNRGYVATGETTPFPYAYHGDWEGVLRDDLHFVIMGKNLDEISTTTGGK